MRLKAGRWAESPNCEDQRQATGIDGRVLDLEPRPGRLNDVREPQTGGTRIGLEAA